MTKAKDNGIATAGEWRAAARAEKLGRAEQLRLPSGATIVASKPGPLEWVISGRIPQRLLAVALDEGTAKEDCPLRPDEILELASFATRLIMASVIEPAIGEGPDEVSLDDIPLEDRAFIFEWACRAMSGNNAESANAAKEDDSIPAAGIERFRSK